MLTGSSDWFVFTYDLHDTPVSIRAASIPQGYVAPTCYIGNDGRSPAAASYDNACDLRRFLQCCRCGL
jgi:hypothetical protein